MRKVLSIIYYLILVYLLTIIYYKRRKKNCTIIIIIYNALKKKKKKTYGTYIYIFFLSHLELNLFPKICSSLSKLKIKSTKYEFNTFVLRNLVKTHNSYPITKDSQLI